MANSIQCSFARYEKKYLITPAQQAVILREALRHMKEDVYGRYTICNIYYDTENWSLIRTSLDKPVYKEKLRLRSYGTPGPRDRVFVEIKKKVSGVVYKRRVVMAPGDAVRYLSGDMTVSPGGQIGREIDWFQGFYQTRPRVFIAYDRSALAGIEIPDLRITFDTNLRWRDMNLDLRAGDWGNPLLLPDQILMEIKIPGAAPLWLSRVLSRAGVFPASFSKYGVCYRDFLSDHSEREVRYGA